MKKQLSIFTALLLSLPLIAQVNFEHVSLNEALAKAKQQDKNIFIMVSTTWCGSCKQMKKEIFPTKEAGEYFNRNFINLYFEVDIADPDSLGKEYKVRGYPTFLILDKDKKLLGTTMGSAGSAFSFIGRVEKAINPEGFAKKLETDSTYAFFKLEKLLRQKKNEEAIAYADYLVKSRSLKENFTEGNLGIIKELFPTFDLESALVKVSIENRDAIAKYIGAEIIDNFLWYEVYQALLGGIYFDGDKNEQKEFFTKKLIFIDQYPVLQSDYTRFLKNNIDAVVNKNFIDLCKSGSEAIKRANDKGISEITTLVGRYAESNDDKNQMIALLSESINHTKSQEIKDQLQAKKESYKQKQNK